MLESNRYLKLYRELRRKSNKKKVNYLKNYNLNLKTKSFSYTNQPLYLHVPSNWNIVKLDNLNLQRTVFYLYSNCYYVTLTSHLFHDFINYDRNYRVIYGTARLLSVSYTLINTLLRSTFKLFNVPSFVKIKFKGKGYYVYKGKRNTITPQFNYYHRIYVYSFFSELKFIRKTSIIIFGYLLPDLLKTGMSIKSKRPINIFTGRGVRFARQIVYKKTGKVSSYR